MRCTGLQPDTYAGEQYQATAISSLPNHPLHLTAALLRFCPTVKSPGCGQRQVSGAVNDFFC